MKNPIAIALFLFCVFQGPLWGADSVITVAVTVGGHPYEEENVASLLEGLAPEIDASIILMDEFVQLSAEQRDSFEVVVFFNYQNTGADGGLPDAQTMSAIERLGDRGQGIIIWHHGQYSYATWSTWIEIMGCENLTFNYAFEQELFIEVVDPDHPLTRGIESWSLIEETYYEINDPLEEDGNEILLTTDHALSCGVIGWTRLFRDSRVFVFRLGHDNLAYADPGFQNVFKRGMQWTAQTIGVPGCTDSSAINFNPRATDDDSSCVHVNGLASARMDGKVLIRGTGGRILVTAAGTGPHAISILDLSGKRAFTGAIPASGTHEFSLSPGPGIYLVRVSGPAGKYVRKIALF
jgi:type 1 glutamine amidotransferase